MLRLLCAGAAKGLVETLNPSFHDATDVKVQAAFGAVGALKARLDAGESCDVIVLTAKLIDAMVGEGRVRADSVAALGSVPTGIAVRDGDGLPKIDDAASLRATLVAAGAIYFPDPERATAGIHFTNVLRKLGIDGIVAPRRRSFANGATAMRALADEGRNGDIGCTQMTEIRYTAGVVAVGALPSGFDLSTVYAAAVMRESSHPDRARQFVALLTGASSAALRVDCGFLLSE